MFKPHLLNNEELQVFNIAKLLGNHFPNDWLNHNDISPSIESLLFLLEDIYNNFYNYYADESPHNTLLNLLVKSKINMKEIKIFIDYLFFVDENIRSLSNTSNIIGNFRKDGMNNSEDIIKLMLLKDII